MTNNTTKSYSKNANRAQTERSFKRLSRRNTRQSADDFYLALTSLKIVAFPGYNYVDPEG